MVRHEDEDRQSPDRTSDEDSAHPTVVGIGASAGALSALKELFQRVPAHTGVPWVVVVHLSPEHESHLAELLQSDLKMPVQQVSETVPLEADHVYVIPPNANLEAIDTHLRLSELEERRRERAPIDHFFRTLSETHDGNAVGIILTGTGSDGALGVKDIKEKGGLAIVQDPEEAEYDGMPLSAISTGLVDLILPLAEIPQAVLRYASTEPRVRIPVEGEEPKDDDRLYLQQVFAQLRTRTGRDFTRYKRSTLIRRIARRMQLHHVEELGDYLERLRTDAAEVMALSDDLLITVTTFFRDPEVFEHLEKVVIPGLFQGKGPDDELRVWSVGCATGEEAYSVAMLLAEAAGRHATPPRLKVFASDLHEPSLEKARAGTYPGDIERDVGPERLRRFFQQENGNYRIRQELREMVVFAPHNLLSDPPFSRLDMILCRNLLIYLQKDVQADVVELFHYALNPAGILVLGPSETVGTAELFRIRDKKTSVYERRNVPPRDPRLPVFPLTRGRLPQFAEQRRGMDESMSYGAVHQRMIERLAAPSLLVNADDRVVHLSERAGRYLVHPGGEPTASITKLVRDELRIELRTALQDAREEGRAHRTRPVRVAFNGETGTVGMDVRPSSEPNEEGFVLIIFDEHSEPPSSRPAPAGAGEGAGEKAETSDTRQRKMEAELDASRQRLKSVIDRYETSREEMRASNEELQSTNEELRSTMEELETSKEELQSMNEELQTVNQENRHKVEELAQLSSDLRNLLTATDIATLFLDRDLRILRFTPKVSDLFNVRMTDQGRPISDLTHSLGYDDLVADARGVLDHLVPIEREVQDEEGRWYLTRVLPYRSRDDRIGGVVITFVDITDRKHDEERLAKMVNVEGVGILTFDREGVIIGANDAFLAMSGYRRKDVESRRLTWRALTPEEYLVETERQMARLAETGRVGPYEKEYALADGSRRWLLFAGASLGDGTIIEYCLDVSDRKRAEDALLTSEARYRALFESIDESFCVIEVLYDDDGAPVDYRFLEANPAFQQITGLEDPVGRTVLELVPGLEREWIVTLADVAATREPKRFIQEARDLGRWYETYAFPVNGPGDRRVAILSTDVTAQRETERTLEQRVAERTREVRALAETLSIAEQEERQRLSHLLHDDLQQLLYGIQMKISLAREHALRENQEDVLVQIDRSLTLLDNAIHRTRQLTVDLNPPILEGEGLMEALEWLRSHMRDLHGVEVEIHASDDVQVRAPDLRILLFQITRELLFNVAKHAGTDHAEVEVAIEGDQVKVVVTDHGRGFDPAVLDSGNENRTGLGLFSVRERLRMRGGELEIHSGPQNGTRIVAYAPFPSGS